VLPALRGPLHSAIRSGNHSSLAGVVKTDSFCRVCRLLQSLLSSHFCSLRAVTWFISFCEEDHRGRLWEELNRSRTVNTSFGYQPLTRERHLRYIRICGFGLSSQTCQNSLISLGVPNKTRT
jgi:hypothetical protein